MQPLKRELNEAPHPPFGHLLPCREKKSDWNTCNDINLRLDHIHQRW